MRTRYQQIREAVAALAAPPDEQAAHLDRLFSSAARGSAATYGCDELALCLDDIFAARNDMIEHGELVEPEAVLIRPLNDLLTRLSGQHNAEFWRREALYADARWDNVRALAKSALSALPDEERAVGRSGHKGC